MATFFEVQKAALKRMNQAAELTEKFGFNTIAESIRERMEEMVKRELVVVVAGEVKRGKSALLNALLNETEPVCPVDADVCTNAVTILRYGETEQIRVYIEDSTAPEGVKIENINRSQIAEYVSEAHNPSNYKNVFQIEVQLPNELLKEGVVFVDTPGVGSLNAEHAETTLGFLPNADMLLFVTDTASPMTETELKFLKRGYEYCDCVVFPLTKMDLEADYDVILTGNQGKISQTLEIPKEQVQIVPVSSKAKLKFLKNRDRESYYRNSNYAQLEETIWSTIAKRQAEVRIQPYLMIVEEELRKMLDDLVAQCQVLGNSSAAKELGEQLQQYQDELEKLQEDGADWQDALNQFFVTKKLEMNETQTRIRTDAQNKLMKRKTDLKTKICEPENYNQLLGEINDIFTQGMIATQMALDSGLNKEILKLRQQMKLDVEMNQDILQKMDFVPDNEVSVDFPKKKAWDRITRQGREMNSNKFGIVAVCSTAGTVIGGFTGGALGTAGGPGGTVAGAGGGAIVGEKVGEYLGRGIAFTVNVFKGVKALLSKKKLYDETDAALVINTLQTHITSSYSGMSTKNSITLQMLQSDTVSGFKKLLKKRKEEIKQNIKKINENLALEKKEIPKRQKEFADQIEQSKELLEKLIILQDKISKLNLQAAAKKEKEKVQEQSAVGAKKKETDTEKKVVEYGWL